MVSVRPEYGPTLRDVAGPHWARLPRPVRLAAIALGALVVLGLVVSQLTGGGRKGLKTVVVRTPALTFNIGHRAAIERVDPQGDEVLRLQTGAGRDDTQSYAVRPLTLPAYTGDVSAGFLAASTREIEDLERIFPGLVYRGEGRARIAELPGYQILFQLKRGTTTVYGKRILLVPDEDGARQGAEITMLADRSAAIANVDAVGNNGLLKAPLRSFRFGTEVP